MPQLDIMSFPTQIFWAIVFLSAIYLVLIKMVLPDLLLHFRIRSRLLKDLERAIVNYENSHTSKLKRLDEHFARINASISKNTDINFVNSNTKALTSFDKYMKKQDLLAFIECLEKDARKQAFLPFVTLIAPTDEFILLLSFTFFFIIFYSVSSEKLIGHNLDAQIKELTLKFDKLALLRETNIQLAIEIKHMLAFADKDGAILSAQLGKTLKEIDNALIMYNKKVKLAKLFTTFKSTVALTGSSLASDLALLSPEDLGVRNRRRLSFISLQSLAAISSEQTLSNKLLLDYVELLK
jgi:hypothetical protein